MPTLRVELFEGRTAEQKRALAKELTDACVRVLGCSADGVDVLFSRDAPRELVHRRRALVGQGGEAESDLTAPQSWPRPLPRPLSSCLSLSRPRPLP